MKINSSNVTIMVKNMDAAINFYTSIGLTLSQRWDDHYAMITAPDVVIGLHPAEGNIESGNQISIGFMIDDIADAKKIMEENNIPYEFRDGKSGKYVNFKDPDGTALYFTQPAWN